MHIIARAVGNISLLKRKILQVLCYKKVFSFDKMLKKFLLNRNLKS